MRPSLSALLILPLLALPAQAQSTQAQPSQTREAVKAEPPARQESSKPAKPDVDALFEQLYEANNPLDGHRIEHAIVEAWSKTDSDTINALMQGGMAVMEKGDYKRAEEIFSQMIALKPDFPEAYNKRATVRFLAGDYAGSVADIERTLKLEPRHFGALAGLGTIMERLDNLPEALKAYRRALAADPYLEDGPEKVKDIRRRIDARTL
ncbi:MAG TPA: tetratricopeptide repeat protein [Ferrovibrio sp.]|uniref:tetratricopeptide repeat protein n=1 Tax=Ferrovibrio sp. TaxID=1917215 RepID=UPI002ED3211B